MTYQAATVETKWPTIPDVGESRGATSNIDPDEFVAPGSGGSDTMPRSGSPSDTLRVASHRDPQIRLLPRRLPVVEDKVERLLVVGDFEGIVEHVDRENATFRARLIDLAAGDTFASEVADFPISDLRSDDLELLHEDAVFRFRVVYRIKRSGTRQRFSEVIFRRIPAWRARHFEFARKQASELDAYFSSGE